MKTVRYINDKYDLNKVTQWFKNILTVGEALPVLNGIYEVSKEIYDNGELIGYVLKDFEFLNYTYVGAGFRKERFEVVQNKFIPNNLDNEGNLVMEKKFILKIDF